MQARKYEIEIFESVLNFTHGDGQLITEYYVPDLGMIVNKKAIFICRDNDVRDRVPETFETIELSYDVVSSLRALLPLLQARDILEKQVREGLGFENE